MAMRLYNRDEWREELQTKWKLRPTGERTATAEIWMTAKGYAISIPELEAEQLYPDSLLNLVHERLQELGEDPFGKEAERHSEQPPVR